MISLVFHSATNRPPRMNRNSVLVFAFLILALSAAYAEVVQWRACPLSDSNAPLNCTIHEVRVDPCKEAEENKPCKLKRGSSGTISFDYTPGFSGDNLQARAYWASQIVDLPFMGMNSNACLSTTCPAVAGQRSSYQVELPLSKKFPVRTYDIKWRLWNEQEQECCIMFQVRLSK